MKLWLDDVRDPAAHGCIGWVWARTAAEAIALLKSGHVVEASLDHDLAWEHYPWNDVQAGDYKEPTGYAVVEWMEQNNMWPPDGVRVHSMNPVGRQRMEAAIRRHYESAA